MDQNTFVVCGHKMNEGTTSHSCVLRRNHEGKHYEAFIAWNDLGETGPIGDVEKRERGLAERHTAGVPAKAEGEPAAKDRPMTRKRRSERPASILASNDASDEHVIMPKVVQGEMVRVRLADVIAYDHKNPRQLPLVEEARRLMREGVAHSQNPTFCDLLERVSDLYSSIPAVGLIEPFVVQKLDNGQHELTAGWRRMTALLILFGEDCMVWAATAGTSKEKASLASLVENISRRDMPWHLQAVAFADLQETNSTQDLHKATGVSVSQINNLIRVRKQLHPSIWEIVCKWGGTTRAMKIEPMLKLAGKTHEQQLETWRQMTEEKQTGQLPSGAPLAQPVIDPADLMVQRPGPVAVRAMTDKEAMEFVAVLRVAVSTHETAKSPAASGLRLALGAVEAVTGQPNSKDVDQLRTALRQSRTLGEAQLKAAGRKDARATTPSKVHRRETAKKATKKAASKSTKTPAPQKGARHG